MMWWPAFGKIHAYKPSWSSPGNLWIQACKQMLIGISIWAYTASADTECQKEMFMFTACNFSSVVQLCFVAVDKKQKNNEERSKRGRCRSCWTVCIPLRRLKGWQVLFFISYHCLLCSVFSYGSSLVLGVQCGRWFNTFYILLKTWCSIIAYLSTSIKKPVCGPVSISLAVTQLFKVK